MHLDYKKLGKSTNIKGLQHQLIDRQFDSGHHLWVSNTEESLDVLKEEVVLTTAESKKLDEIQYLKRKREFLSVRRLVQDQFGTNERIIYSDTGKPMLKESGYCISISHSGDYAAVIVHPTLEVGIDVQMCTPKILRILKRFAHPEELTNIKGDIWKSLVYWCSKEALFKWYALGGVDFKEDLFIEPFDLFDKGALTAYVKKTEPYAKVSLQYEKLLDAMLVYTANG